MSARDQRIDAPEDHQTDGHQQAGRRLLVNLRTAAVSAWSGGDDSDRYGAFSGRQWGIIALAGWAAALVWSVGLEMLGWGGSGIVVGLAAGVLTWGYAGTLAGQWVRAVVPGLLLFAALVVWVSSGPALLSWANVNLTVEDVLAGVWFLGVAWLGWKLITVLLLMRNSNGSAGSAVRPATAAALVSPRAGQPSGALVPTVLEGVWRQLAIERSADFATWMIGQVDERTDPETIRELADRRWPEWERPMAGPNRDERSICLHEAAHAVIAVRLGCVVKSVEIYDDHQRERSGRGGSAQSFRPVPSLPLWDEKWNAMAISLAGRQADLVCGTHDDGSVVDWSEAEAAARGILSTGRRPAGYSGPLSVEGLLVGAVSRTGGLVVAEWTRIEAVAGALLEKRRLGHHDVRQILRRAEARGETAQDRSLPAPE